MGFSKITSRIVGPVATVFLLVGAGAVPEVRASPFDGVAGAAVGFALGAMVAGAARPAPVYVGRSRRVVVYRDRRPAPRRYAAAPARHRPAGPIRGAAISTVSDPFAGSGAKPIPVSGR